MARLARPLPSYLLALAALAFLPHLTLADTITLGFHNITGNSAVNAATGEGQLFVDVSNDGLGSGQVKFTFRNLGPLASSICDVYFDDGTLLGIASITSSLGVDFAQGASPGNLPGGNSISPAFQTTAGFSADSEPPTQPNGVNPGESLTITFNLINGKTYADTLAALEQAVGEGSLRIGIHVQGFGDGGSESFVNNPPPNPVPEPGSLALLAIGSVGLVVCRRFRR